MSNEIATTQQNAGAVTMGFGSLQSFEFMQRTAKMFTHSSMVPTAYRNVIEKGYGKNVTVTDNPSALPNCIIALNMSQRMNADPLMIMQNLHVIDGRPSWSSQFIIAAINSCGRYSPLRFDIKQGPEIDATCTTFEWENGKKNAIVTKTRVSNTSCIAWAVELATQTRLESPAVTMEMAVNEGWFGKNGSKWQSMPDLMLRYRSAAFFGRIYAPELLMGLPSAEETSDVIDITPQSNGGYAMTRKSIDQDTGEITPPAATAQPAALPNYTDEQFDKSLPMWRGLIETGKKTVDQIITMANSKHPLTDQQKQAIRAVPIENDPGTETPTPEQAAAGIAPNITLAQVKAQLQAASDIDALYTAADLIDSVANPDNRRDLDALFQTRQLELEQQ